MAKSKVDGEPKKTPATETPPITILSIKVVGNVQVCLNNKPVKKPNEPNWSNQIPPDQWYDGMGSIRPGVFLLPKSIMQQGSDISDQTQTTNQYSIQQDVDKLLTINETIEDVPEYEALENESKRKIRRDTKSFEVSTIMNVFREWTTPPAPPSGATSADNQRSLLKMEIDVNTAAPGKKAMMSGLLKNFIFYGNLSLDKPGKQTIYLAPLEEPRTLKRIWGQMKWYLLLYEGDSLQHCNYLIGADTRIELFWILGQPRHMYKRGVWAETLRLLDPECGGVGDVADVIQRVVNYCHSGAGLRYDCYAFGCYYSTGHSGGAFNLNAYLHRTSLYCNCYDQGGALQTLLGALGITVQWTYMQPYGYLKNTHLIGWGQCNNPGFLARKLPPITPQNAVKRLPFGNHVFCLYASGDSQIVLDACAGPHFGGILKESFVSGYKQSYINNCIDGLTTCYENSGFMTSPGNINNMDTSCQGIVDVHAVLSNPIQSNESWWKSQHKRLQQFISDVDYDAAGQDLSALEKKQGVLYDWPNPSDVLNLDKDYWQQSFQDIRLGIDIAVKQWSFKATNSAVTIEYFVSNNLETPKQNLLVLAMAHNHPENEMVSKAGNNYLGHLNIYSNSEYYRVEAWWFFNICVRVTAYNLPVDIDELTRQLHQLIDSKLNPEIAKYLPVIETFNVYTSPGTPYPGSVAVGETVTIEIRRADNQLLEGHGFDLEFFLSQNNIRFQEQSIPHPENERVYSITFIALSPGVSTVKFLLADQETLLSSTHREISINVM